MSTPALKVADDYVVTLEYVLTLEDGEEVDRSDEDFALQILQGHGQIIPGLEKALYGMAVGESKKVVVAPAEGYGEYDEDSTDTLPRSAFPDDVELEPGLELELHDHESDDVYIAYVAEIDGDEVVIDFNHPLAGETLYFEVKVMDIRPATAEEIDHGHVHDDEHNH